jgi:hypothetical protein
MASQKDIAEKSPTAWHDRMNFRVCLSSLFLTFALSLSLGEMGVLRTLSESGGRACVQSALFLFDESCRSEVPTFGQQSLPTIAQ